MCLYREFICQHIVFIFGQERLNQFFFNLIKHSFPLKINSIYTQKRVPSLVGLFICPLFLLLSLLWGKTIGCFYFMFYSFGHSASLNLGVVLLKFITFFLTKAF